MTTDQKKAHLRMLQSLPVKTHKKKWPEPRWGGSRVKDGKWRAH